MSLKKLWMFVFIAVMTISFGTAEAQKKRKKRKKGKKTNTEATTGGGGGGTATKVTPGVVTYDWGFAHFYAKTKVKKKKAMWSLSSFVRIFGDVPDRSIFEIVVKQKRKTVLTYRCPASKFLEGLRRRWEGVPVCGYLTGCKSKELIKKTGKFKVEVHFINDQTDKKTKVATHTIEVRATKRMFPTRKPRASDLYVNRNSEVLNTIMYLRTRRAKPYDISGDLGLGSVHLLLNASPVERVTPYFRKAHLRCKVNGKRIKINVNRVEFRGLSKWGRKGGATIDKKKPKAKRGIVSEKVLFPQYHVNLPLYWEESGNSNFAGFAANKGKWDCVIRTGEGDPMVQFRWEIGDDGKPKAHPEQEKGLTLLPNAYLVETIIPKKSPLYVRLDPKDVKNNAFHGRGWKTKAGKNMAKAVKKKGKPKP